MKQQGINNKELSIFFKVDIFMLYIKTNERYRVCFSEQIALTAHHLLQGPWYCAILWLQNSSALYFYIPLFFLYVLL